MSGQEKDDTVVEFRPKASKEGKELRKRREQAPVSARLTNEVGYKPGREYLCRIDAIEPGGYAVTVVKDHLPGYLQSDRMYLIGDQVFAVFVCVENFSRLLMHEPSRANRKRSYFVQQTPDADETASDD